MQVKLADITVSKTNPRTTFDEEAVNELANSIESKGVIQAIVVRPANKPGKYELVCGERRYRASLIVMKKHPERNDIPANIRELTDDEARELQIIENLQRKDVHPMEEAVAFKGLIDLKKFEVKEIAARVGKSETYVAQRLKFNDLVPEFQKAFYQNRMKIVDAQKVCVLSAETQKHLWEEEFADSTGTIEIQRWKLNQYQGKLSEAPFDVTDATLQKKVGACTTCPFNTASNAVLFPDEKGTGTCLNIRCFKDKSAVSFERRLAEALEDPSVILVTSSYQPGEEAKKLMAKGHVVYSGFAFNKVYAPSEVDPSEYDVDDYDSEEEMQKQIKDDLEEYAKDIAEYKAKIESGKYKKALLVEGEERGTYVYGKISTDKQPAVTNIKNKEADKITAEDITSEIARLKNVEKRKKELDGEKQLPLMYELLAKNKEFVRKDELSNNEVRALLVLLADYGGFSSQKEIHKQVGLKVSNDYNNAAMFKHVALLSEKSLTESLNAVVRVLLLDKLKINATDADRNGKAAAVFALARDYAPEAAKEIEMAQMNQRAKREERLDKRIKELQVKLKELKAAEKKPEVKKEPSTKKKASK